MRENFEKLTAYVYAECPKNRCIYKINTLVWLQEYCCYRKSRYFLLSPVLHVDCDGGTTFVTTYPFFPPNMYTCSPLTSESNVFYTYTLRILRIGFDHMPCVCIVLHTIWAHEIYVLSKSSQRQARLLKRAANTVVSRPQPIPFRWSMSSVAQKKKFSRVLLWSLQRIHMCTVAFCFYKP